MTVIKFNSSVILKEHGFLLPGNFTNVYIYIYIDIYIKTIVCNVRDIIPTISCTYT